MEKLTLLVGDKVIVQSEWNRRKVSRVEKITPSGAIRVDGVLFNEYGEEKGRYGTSRIYEATEARLEIVKKEQFTKSVLKRMNNQSSLNYNMAVAINNILENKEV